MKRIEIGLDKRQNLKLHLQAAVSEFNVSSLPLTLTEILVTKEIPLDLRSRRNDARDILVGMNCISLMAGKRFHATTFVKVDDPRLHLAEIEQGNLTPGNCSGCIYNRGSDCGILTIAKNQAYQNTSDIIVS